MEACPNGSSTHSVDDPRRRGASRSASPSPEVSRICAGLDGRDAAFGDRTFDHTGFPHLHPDTACLNVRDDTLGQVASRAVSITAGCARAVLGVDIGDIEDETY